MDGNLSGTKYVSKTIPDKVIDRIDFINEGKSPQADAKPEEIDSEDSDGGAAEQSDSNEAPKKAGDVISIPKKHSNGTCLLVLFMWSLNYYQCTNKQPRSRFTI